MKTKLSSRWPILVFIGFMAIVVYMAIDAGNTASAFKVEREYTAQRIAVLDSTLAFLRGESDEIKEQIEQKDSLIAKLEYRGWRLRVQVRDGEQDVILANQIINYNETDSALVELLRSAYSDRIQSRN